MAHAAHRRSRPAQVDAGLGARGRGGRRFRRRRSPPRPTTRRRERGSDLPDLRVAGLLRQRRRRVPTSALPGVQQLGRRRVRRPSPPARRHGVHARRRRRGRGRQGRRRPGLPCAVPPGPGAVAGLQRRGLRPVLGHRAGPRPPADVPFRHRPRTAGRTRPRRRGHQLPHGFTARWAHGAPRSRRRWRARPLPRVEGRHRGDGRIVARVDHDPGRRDLRGPPHVGEAEAVDAAERADPPPGCTPRSCTTRSRSTTAPRPGSRP